MKESWLFLGVALGELGGWWISKISSFKDSLYSYKAVVGSSTGSLLAPLVSLGEFEILKASYTSIKNKDVFNVSPFRTKGKNRGKLRKFNALWRVLIGKKTLGNSKNLKNTIKKYYTKELFNQLQLEGKQHISTVVNLTKDSIEYKSSIDLEYDEVIDWMWASANAPVFMSLFNMDLLGEKNTYVDGGVKEGIPLQKGIEISCELDIDNIDVIVNNMFNPKNKGGKVGGIVGCFLG